MKEGLTEFEHSFSRIAVLFGERSRALMLWHLSDGRPYTASELAICAEISPQSVSNHLSKLLDMGFVSVERRGRHKYYKIGNHQVAQVLEDMAGLVPAWVSRSSARKLETDGTMFARTCYDHLAGKLGVDVSSAMMHKGILIKVADKFEISRHGELWFDELGIAVRSLESRKRALVRKCLDWTENKYHLGGALGAVFFEMMLQNDWIRRKRLSREVLVTAKGRAELKFQLGINF